MISKRHDQEVWFLVTHLDHVGYVIVNKIGSLVYAGGKWKELDNMINEILFKTNWLYQNIFTISLENTYSLLWTRSFAILSLMDNVNYRYNVFGI